MVFLGYGISGDSMIPMLRPDLLRLSSGVSLIQCLHIYKLVGSPQSDTKSTGRHVHDLGDISVTCQP